MKCFTRRAVALAFLVASATALDGIVVPANISAGSTFEVTFQNANSDQYRVYLAASLASINGPTCYLINSTSLKSPLGNLSIPASVGPSANYYSIAIADITTGQGATYSNFFSLGGATGNYSEYENKLNGSPFWSADDLPCHAYECARKCAMASYPDDLTKMSAYNTMKTCILACDGTSEAAVQTAPAHASSTGTSTSASDPTASASATQSASLSTSSDSAANRNIVLAGAAAAGFGALAFLL